MPTLNGIDFPDDWSIIQIEELCDFIVDCIHDTPELSKSFVGYYMIRTSDVGNARIKLAGARYVSKEVYDFRIQRATPQFGDIVVTREAPLGEVGQILSKEKICLGQRLIHYRPSKAKIDPRFLAYSLISPAVQSEFRANKGAGSIVDNLKMGAARKLPIPVPATISDQHAIAQVLSALDDKIELNRKMNETLEAMSHALFKSWFVDFDPVRAKVEGRQPAGMDTETAALFPDAFENTALREVPKGWNVTAIGNVVKVFGGTTPSTKEAAYWEGGSFHWVTPKDLAPLSQPVLLDSERKITESGLAQIGSGLLPKGVLLLSSRAPIGYLAISEIPVAINQGFIAMVCDGELPNYYVLEWVRQNMEEIIGRANGTTFLEISKSNFRPIPVLVPSEPVVQKFIEQVQPLHSRIVANLKETQTLTALRDTLLPRLMSGEVRVKDVEEEVVTPKRELKEEKKEHPYRRHLRPA